MLFFCKTKVHLYINIACSLQCVPVCLYAAMLVRYQIQAFLCYLYICPISTTYEQAKEMHGWTRKLGQRKNLGITLFCKCAFDISQRNEYLVCFEPLHDNDTCGICGGWDVFSLDVLISLCMVTCSAASYWSICEVN